MADRTVLAASVVVSAHNEERAIGRLLGRLNTEGAQRGLEVIVVCNGCTDSTAEVASRFAGVRVGSIPDASKYLAMRRGDRLAATFPRLFVDADVEIDAEDVFQLADAVREGVVHASAPSRVLPMDDVHRIVRWYYDVWQELPQVRYGLFGRGVVALSEEGNRRYGQLPPAMSDDVVASEAFAPEERVVLESAKVLIRPPQTIADLIRRRVRVQTGNAQADSAGLRGGPARTSLSALIHVVRCRPGLLPKVPVFLGVAVVARFRARRAIRRGDFRTWLRDESSRA